MRLPTGEWMALPFESRFASEAYITGADVDWGSERLLASLLHGGGVFLDVGANVGYYSLYMLPRVAAVYSFEPDPRALAGLRRNVGGKQKVKIVACAVVLRRDELDSYFMKMRSGPTWRPERKAAKQE